jgi:hypothetical protein
MPKKIPKIIIHATSGTSYEAGTPPEISGIIDQEMDSNNRLRLFYGNTETGNDWNEEFHTIGYVSRSSGKVKVPILLPHADSKKGITILTTHIVKIIKINNSRRGSDVVLYQHPEYSPGRIERSGNIVFRNGISHAKFLSPKKAQQYVEFLLGINHMRGRK